MNLDSSKHVYASMLLMALAAGCGAADDSTDESDGTRDDAVTTVAEGDYVLQAVHSGKCVDVQFSGTANGTRVQQWSCNGTGAQLFHFHPVDNGIYEILNPQS